MMRLGALVLDFRSGIGALGVEPSLSGTSSKVQGFGFWSPETSTLALLPRSLHPPMASLTSRLGKLHTGEY